MQTENSKVESIDPSVAIPKRFRGILGNAPLLLHMLAAFFFIIYVYLEWKSLGHAFAAIKSKSVDPWPLLVEIWHSTVRNIVLLGLVATIEFVGVVADAFLKRVESKENGRERDSVQRHNDELRTQISGLQSELSEQKKANAPRRIGQSQQDAIANGLRKIGALEITLIVSGNDIEIVTFANELQSTLQRAGWVVKRITAITTSAVVGMGILVSDGCGEQIESIAKAIANVFLSNGIATGVAKTRNPNRTADQSIRISVGQKPPNTPVA